MSAHSPGPVGSDEVLIRIVVAPQHVSKGKPRASALTDAERGGLSVFRERYACDAEIQKVAKGLVEKARAANPGKPAGVQGVLLMDCREVRSIHDEPDNAPCYCVYDTALAHDHSHTEVFQRVAGAPEELRLERRQRLFKAVSHRFLDVSQFRDGLLIELAPNRS